MTQDLNSVTVDENEDAVFVCELSKADEPITWLVNGQAVEESDKYAITSDGLTYRLTLRGCQPADSAEIGVIAGSCKSTAQLLVNGESPAL